jgi:AsmA family protein
MATSKRKPCFQTGAAVALGTLLTPVAALLAFVDKGLAKDANCAAVIGRFLTSDRAS